MATYLNPAAEIFIPYQNHFLPPPYNHHHLQVTQSSSYSSYPLLPLPYYKTYYAPPTTTTTSSSFPSCSAITPVFSTSTATCPPPSSNYYQYSSLSPDWYGSTNTYPSPFQPSLPISKLQTYVYDHQMYGSTSVPVEEVEKNVVLEEELVNPTTADDIPASSRVGKGKNKMNVPPSLGGSRHHHHHQPTSVRYNQRRMIWKPKSVISSGHNGASTTSDHDRVMDMLLPSRKLVDENCDSTQNDSHETTLMIRNIPNKYTREMLMNLLEEHCKEVNEMGAPESEDEKIREDERLSAFDFLYLPIDFKTGCNKGYAFVNMINSSGAAKLKLFLTDHKWGCTSPKRFVKSARQKYSQGKEALVKRFENCYFQCDSDKLLPLCFSPFRDGSGGFVVESTVGKCCGPRFHQNEADGDHKLSSE